MTGRARKRRLVAADAESHLNAESHLTAESHLRVPLVLKSLALDTGPFDLAATDQRFLSEASAAAFPALTPGAPAAAAASGNATPFIDLSSRDDFADTTLASRSVKLSSSGLRLLSLYRFYYTPFVIRCPKSFEGAHVYLLDRSSDKQDSIIPVQEGAAAPNSGNNFESEQGKRAQRPQRRIVQGRGKQEKKRAKKHGPAKKDVDASDEDGDDNAAAAAAKEGTSDQKERGEHQADGPGGGSSESQLYLEIIAINPRTGDVPRQCPECQRYFKTPVAGAPFLQLDLGPRGRSSSREKMLRVHDGTMSLRMRVLCCGLHLQTNYFQFYCELSERQTTGRRRVLLRSQFDADCKQWKKGAILLSPVHLEMFPAKPAVESTA